MDSENGYSLFNKVTDAIVVTPNHPKNGITFTDPTSAFGHPKMAELARRVCKRLCMEKNQVVIGLPTRGT